MDVIERICVNMHCNVEDILEIIPDPIPDDNKDLIEEQKGE